DVVPSVAHFGPDWQVASVRGQPVSCSYFAFLARIIFSSKDRDNPNTSDCLDRLFSIESHFGLVPQIFGNWHGLVRSNALWCLGSKDPRRLSSHDVCNPPLLRFEPTSLKISHPLTIKRRGSSHFVWPDGAIGLVLLLEINTPALLHPPVFFVGL